MIQIHTVFSLLSIDSGVSINRNLQRGKKIWCMVLEKLVFYLEKARLFTKNEQQKATKVQPMLIRAFVIRLTTKKLVGNACQLLRLLTKETNTTNGQPLVI